MEYLEVVTVTVGGRGLAVTVRGVGGSYCWGNVRLLLLLLGKREAVTVTFNVEGTGDCYSYCSESRMLLLLLLGEREAVIVSVDGREAVTVCEDWHYWSEVVG